MLELIDVSSYQNGLHVGEISSEGVIVKVTDGVKYVSPSWTKQVTQALDAHKIIGLYHYAAGTHSPEQEATHFLITISKYMSIAQLFLDFEAENLFNTAGVVWAAKWLNIVYSQTGIKPIIYMNLRVENDLDWSDIARNGYGLWLSAPEFNNVDFERQPYLINSQLKNWKQASLLQYTTRGHLNGWTEPLDINLFFGSKLDWNERGQSGR